MTAKIQFMDPASIWKQANKASKPINAMDELCLSMKYHQMHYDKSFDGPRFSKNLKEWNDIIMNINPQTRLSKRQLEFFSEEGYRDFKV